MTETMSLREEKDLVRGISFLEHRGRKIVTEIEESMEAPSHKLARDTSLDFEEDDRDVDGAIAYANRAIFVETARMRATCSNINREIEDLAREVEGINYEEEMRNISNIKADIHKIKASHEQCVDGGSQ